MDKREKTSIVFRSSLLVYFDGDWNGII